jgi:hypothetical protein
MPEPVSTTLGVCLISYAAAQGFTRGSTAVSREARAIRDAVTAVVDRAEQSQALFGHKAAAISALRALANAAGDANESDLDPLAVRNAEDFIRALPDHFPIPELASEPDGSVSLDWLQARNRLFSLSIGSSDRLAFAWLDGSDRGHGVARFDGCNLPPRVREGIESIIGHASLRPA